MARRDARTPAARAGCVHLAAPPAPGAAPPPGRAARHRPPPPAAPRRAPPRSGPERPRDHHLLHLVGALADGQDLGVAVEAAHGVLLDEAVATVDLHGLLGRAHGQPPGLELGLGGGERELTLGVLLP